MTSCREVRELLPAYVGMELEAGDEKAIREHLNVCPECNLAAMAFEPSLILALPQTKVQEDEYFIAEVMAGVRRRRLEKKLVDRRAPWLAAAAAVLLMVGGYTVLRSRMNTLPVMAVQTPVIQPTKTAQEALVQVREGGVRVYHLAGNAKDKMQIAFVVDPQAEL